MRLKRQIAPSSGDKLGTFVTHFMICENFFDRGFWSMDERYCCQDSTYVELGGRGDGRKDVLLVQKYFKRKLFAVGIRWVK